MKLKPLVDNIEKRADAYADRTGVVVEVHYDADPELVVRADYTKLETILRNILSNSISYTKSGGLVQLFVESDRENVRFTISDTGIGVSEEDMPRVFDRFFRADKSRNRSAGGTGLGLPIAKEYVEAHGGSIDLRSQLGKGTTVFVDMPIVVQTGAGDD